MSSRRSRSPARFRADAVVDRLSLRRRGSYFACPACDDGKTKAKIHPNGRFFCNKCKASGDGADLLALSEGIAPGEAFRRMEATQVGPVPVRWRTSPPSGRPARNRSQQATANVLRWVAEHYLSLGAPGPAYRDHLDTLASDAQLPRSMLDSVERGSRAAWNYLGGRGLDDALLESPVTERLVGVAPAWDSGLARYLERCGGLDAVDEAEACGLLKPGKRGRYEFLHHRVVYVWRDALGRVVYLTGRRIEPTSASESPRVLALPVSHGPNERGVPRPVVPFGLAGARRLATATRSAVTVVEGEFDALAAQLAGRPAVATGGTGRCRAEDLAAALAGLDAVVAFDRDGASRTDERAIELAANIGGRVARRHFRV